MTSPLEQVRSDAAPAARPRARVMAVLPAYNAAATIQRTVADIPPGSVHEILVVDDGSRDDTVAVAREATPAPAPAQGARAQGA